MDMSTTGVSNTVNPVDVAALSAKDQAALLAVQQQADTKPGGALGKDEFLNLLVTQLANQDPMNPMDSTESIAQLAQFSALEQMQNVGDQIEALRRSSGMTDALLLQGQTVEAVDGSGTTYSGTVDSAIWGEDGMILTIGGVPVPMASIVELKLVAPVAEETTAQTTGDPTEETPADSETLPDPVVEST